MHKTGDFAIYDLLLTIDYFSLAFLSHRDVLSVAQTTVLIGNTIFQNVVFYARFLF